MSSPTDEIVIVGFGSSLRGDDAAGPEAARRLAARGFHAIAVHQLTPELAEPLAAAREAWFLDADVRVAPGEVAIAPIDESVAGPLEHHATPASLLRLSREAFGAVPKAWLAGMGGANFDLSDRLSPAAEAAIETVIRRIVRSCLPTRSSEKPKRPPMRS
jgi:hydrogenase maturation protease